MSRTCKLDQILSMQSKTFINDDRSAIISIKSYSSHFIVFSASCMFSSFLFSLLVKSFVSSARSCYFKHEYLSRTVAMNSHPARCNLSTAIRRSFLRVGPLNLMLTRPRTYSLKILSFHKIAPLLNLLFKFKKYQMSSIKIGHLVPRIPPMVRP